MKILRIAIVTVIVYLAVFATGTQFSACTKTNTVHDTIVKKDTVIVKDTIYDLSDGLVAYFNFNSGTLKDSSGFGNHIVFSNATKTADRFGNSNNAYLFDGATSYMQVKNSSSLNPAAITLMAIVKLNGYYLGNSHGNEILMKGPSDQSQGVYTMRITPRNNDCCSFPDTAREYPAASYGDYGYSAGAQDTTYFVKTGKWVKFVMTYDGMQSKFYIDGQLKATYVGAAVFTKNSNDLYIGKTENGTFPYWLNGAIDEIRIYNRALAAGAIKQWTNLAQ